MGGTSLRQGAQTPDATISSYGVPRQSAIKGVNRGSMLWNPQKGNKPAAVCVAARRITPQFAITWQWNCAIWMPGRRPKAL